MLRIGFPSFEKIYTAFLFKYVFIFSFLQNFWLKIESHCERFGQKSSAWISLLLHRLPYYTAGRLDLDHLLLTLLVFNFRPRVSHD